MNIWQIVKSNRGALFGMDARIAMAIFASMTVILGYFSYGKINMAKESALLRELQALDSAVQNYQTDMGTFYQFTIDTSDGVNDFRALYDSTRVTVGYQDNWNGPYYTIASTNHLTYGNFTITYGQANRSVCISTSNCYVWIGLSEVDDTIWEQVNSFIDENWGSDPEVTGHMLGSIQSDGITDPRILYYRSVSRKK